jgi:hypothetical protein
MPEHYSYRDVMVDKKKLKKKRRRLTQRGGRIVEVKEAPQRQRHKRPEGPTFMPVPGQSRQPTRRKGTPFGGPDDVIPVSRQSQRKRELLGESPPTAEKKSPPIPMFMKKSKSGEKGKGVRGPVRRKVKKRGTRLDARSRRLLKNRGYTEKEIQEMGR